jgi:hypothetical protein
MGVRMSCPNCQAGRTSIVYVDDNFCRNCGRRISFDRENLEWDRKIHILNRFKASLKAYDELSKAGSNLAGLVASELVSRAQDLSEWEDGYSAESRGGFHHRPPLAAPKTKPDILEDEY